MASDVTTKPFATAKHIDQLLPAIEQISEGVALFDADDRLVFYNQSWWEMNDAAYKTTKIGTTFEDHIRTLAHLGGIPEAAGRIEEWVAERVARHQNPTGLFEMLRENNRCQQVNEQRLDDGSIILVVLDITELKNRERDLREHRDQLEKTVEDRTTQLTLEVAEHKRVSENLQRVNDTLKQTQAELVQSEKMASLGNRVAGVAHEINTPIGVAVTAASYLQDATKDLSGRFKTGELKKSDLAQFVETASTSARIVNANLERAANLIGSFKKVAVDQSSQEKRAFNLAAYLHEIIMTLHSNLKQNDHEVIIECPTDLDLHSFPGALAQVVTNLVMNSLVHGFEGRTGGKITISASVLPTHVEISYRDDGCGMDKKTRLQVFDPFFSTKKGRGGSGLGMNILYNLVTQTLGGRVECRSELGQGSEFVFTMQRLEADSETSI